MDAKDAAWKVIELVRMEIGELKRCQVQYFSLSVTATGAIVSLAAVVTTPAMRGVALLAPLVLLLPCWMIFFDKATTITRLVGFQRAIESCLKRRSPALSWLLAWETAFGEFRQAQDEGRLPSPPTLPIKALLNVFFLTTRHRYWMLNWYTFCALSVLSFVLGYNSLETTTSDFNLPFGIRTQVPERTLWGLPAFGVTIAVVAYTLLVVGQLVRGRHSYEANTRAWQALVERFERDDKGAQGAESASAERRDRRSPRTSGPDLPSRS
jgi:hypothetical protein